jgi:hypothetical protein
MQSDLPFSRRFRGETMNLKFLLSLVKGKSVSIVETFVGAPQLV